MGQLPTFLISCLLVHFLVNPVRYYLIYSAKAEDCASVVLRNKAGIKKHFRLYSAYPGLPATPSPAFNTAYMKWDERGGNASRTTSGKLLRKPLYFMIS